MLNHPTLDQLKTMRLHGMAQAFEEQLHHSNAEALSFDDRLAFLVEREHTLRANRQLTNRLRRCQIETASHPRRPRPSRAARPR